MLRPADPHAASGAHRWCISAGVALVGATMGGSAREAAAAELRRRSLLTHHRVHLEAAAGGGGAGAEAAEERAGAAEARLQLLHSTARDICGAGEPAELLRALLSCCAELTAASTATLWMPDKEMEGGALVRKLQLPEAAAAAGGGDGAATLRLGEGVAGRVALHGRAVCCDLVSSHTWRLASDEQRLRVGTAPPPTTTTARRRRRGTCCALRFGIHSERLWLWSTSRERRAPRTPGP